MTMPNDKQSRAELRQHIGGVSVDLFGGDNLAIFLVSEFEPRIKNKTLDESGTWKQGAIDATNLVLDAIHAHYAPTIEALEAENARLREALTPFAEASAGIDDSCHPDWEMWEHPAAMNVFVRDFRRARSALNPEREEK
ncbi:hypothetical protein [Devosia sp. DBB001]|nr:hypothetical protein [Devosia sp. DBB001]